MKKPILLLTLIAVFFGVTNFTKGQKESGFTVENLLKVRRVGDPQLAPDGQRTLFTVGDASLDENQILTQIYLVSNEGKAKPRQLTNEDRSATSPRWSPDGQKVAYVTGGQVWVMNSNGSNKEQLTKISTGAVGPIWSPDSKWIAFNSDVYPECPDEECNKRQTELAAKRKVKAVVTDRLLFRHWDEWRDVKRTHLLLVPATGGKTRDLTPGDFDSPPYAASTVVNFSFSPDSKEIAFLRNPDRVEATSTNSDIFLMPIEGGPSRNITMSNQGYDVAPVYTADGKFILYRSQATKGFEADRWRLMAYHRETGHSNELIRGFDLSVEEVAPSRQNDYIYFVSGARGRQPIYRIPYGGGAASTMVDGVFATNIQLADDGEILVFANSSMAMPTEIYQTAKGKAEIRAVTEVNRGLTDRSKLNKAEDVQWTGARGAKVHGFLLKPPAFDSRRKYPLLVLIHGGPQSAWNDNWGFRWNPQVFAAAGYVVFMPNPRGSVGYGQQFVDEISTDWGGKVFTDLKNGVMHILAEKYIDAGRIAAAGASYGGYMVNWIEGHNDDPRFRFKVLVSHAGVYNLSSMYGATEELWFPEWEFKGTPWTNATMYDRWSPHKFATKFNTPILVTAGELDYRVPYTESLQLFTTVQRRGIDSRLLIFPDEGHWILKPQNSQIWYQTVLGFMEKHLGKDGRLNSE